MRGGIAGFVVLVAACGGSPPVAPLARPLPAYSGHAVRLFDDTIDPAGVGMDFEKGYRARADSLLRERVQGSDAVLRVKVLTVTAKTDGADKSYQLSLRTVERMAGDHPPAADFTVGVTKASGSYGILKNFEGRLVGYPFIAFVREFVRADGDREVHFHLSPDTKEVQAAVGDAVILGEFGTKK